LSVNPDNKTSTVSFTLAGKSNISAYELLCG